MTIVLNSNSDADTRAIGRRLSGLLQAGDVVVLCGSLGAGKTAFVGGVADGLGIDEQVTSPSFVLMKKYVSGFIPLVHVDVYRVGSLGEFDDLDVFEESRKSVLIVNGAMRWHRASRRIISRLSSRSPATPTGS